MRSAFCVLRSARCALRVQEFAYVGQYHGANCANCQRRDGRTKFCHQKRYILSRSRAFTDNTPPRFPSSKIEIATKKREKRQETKENKTRQERKRHFEQCMLRGRRNSTWQYALGAAQLPVSGHLPHLIT
jgi:hypothetical protein